MKVISFSLWGDNPKYTLGALQNASLARIIYPGWICRYYVGNDTPKDVVKLLKAFDNVQIVETEESGGSALGTMWRFEAASDPEIEVLISRDCDSRLWHREKAAVDEWLTSDKSFHIMRDNHQHATAILAGMWGVRGDKLRNLSELIKQYKGSDIWQVDQNFLRDVIYPMVKDDCVVHDEFFEHKPFPYDRDPQHFVGQSYAGCGRIIDAEDTFQNYIRREMKL